MSREAQVDLTRLVVGALTIVFLSIGLLVILPYVLTRPGAVATGTPRSADGNTPAFPAAYTPSQLKGRGVYIANGCIYCHSQQPRDPSIAPDLQRGWGRPSVPGDYVHDQPHLLGTMRTGPDLFNIAVRQPSRAWHLGHLYQPRAYTAQSIMPAFRFLFEARSGPPQPGESALVLPPGVAPAGTRIIPRPEAEALVDYLLSLDHSYPVRGVAKVGTTP